MKKKIILINFIVLILILLIIELIFGSWLKNNNFKYSIRELRNIKIPISVEYEKIKYDYFFERNNLGFIGDNINSNDIKIIFIGGSTGEEMFVPPKFRIVDQINYKFNKDNYNVKIVNASKAGKSTRGYVNDFQDWFPKINNFNPKIVIFYTGINDANLELPAHFDDTQKKKLKKKIEDYVKNNSILYYLKKKIEDRYFSKIRKHYSLVNENLYKNFNYTNYNQAKLIYKNYSLNEKNNTVINNFSKNLENLNKIIKDKKIIPIFITQINFDGLNNFNLYLINESLKDFCIKNNYNIIKLDEKINFLDEGYFYDEAHTTIKGSLYISNILYSDLKNIILKNIQQINFYKQTIE
jgi:hypothetical protein